MGSARRFTMPRLLFQAVEAPKGNDVTYRSCSLNSLKENIGSLTGVIKGDTRSLD